MERRIMQMLDKVEVPQETSRKAEELLIRELLGENLDEHLNEREEEMHASISLEHRRENKMKRVLGTSMAAAAAVAIMVGTTAHVGLKGEKKVSVATTRKPVVTNEFIEGLKDGKVYKLKEGTNFIDLDLDGTKEEIYVETKSSDVYDKPYTIKLGKQVIEGEVDHEEGIQVRAAMLTKEKDSVQIMFTSEYGSDDCKTQIYNYEKGALVKVGTVAENVDLIKPKNDGSFHIIQPGGPLGEWKNTLVNLVENDHQDIEISGKYRIEEKDEFEDEHPFKYQIKAMQNVKMYTSMDRSSKQTLGFITGQSGKTLKVINNRWLYVENSKGQRGYLEITPTDFFIDGRVVNGWEVFEGLPYAG